MPFGSRENFCPDRLPRENFRRIPGLICLLILALAPTGCSNRRQVAAISEEAGEAEARGQTDLAITRWNSVLKLDKSERRCLSAESRALRNPGSNR